MRVKCVVSGCPSVYVSGETPSSKGPRYVCSHHTDRELRAAGVLKTDRTDKDVRFQKYVFDKKLGRKKKQRYTRPLPEVPTLIRPVSVESAGTNPEETVLDQSERS